MNGFRQQQNAPTSLLLQSGWGHLNSPKLGGVARPVNVELLPQELLSLLALWRLSGWGRVQVENVGLSGAIGIAVGEALAGLGENLGGKRLDSIFHFFDQSDAICDFHVIEELCLIRRGAGLFNVLGVFGLYVF